MLVGSVLGSALSRRGQPAARLPQARTPGDAEGDKGAVRRYRAGMPSPSGEPNTLTRADHVRRAYTTVTGSLKPGVSGAEYFLAYERALALDHTHGVDPQFAAVTIAELRVACAPAGARKRAPRRRRAAHAAANTPARPRTG
jgi:hypothetical protein